MRRKLAATRDGQITNPSFLAALYSSAPALVRYVARAVADGSGAGVELFDDMAMATEEFLTRTWPERFPDGSARARDAATALVAQTSGTIVLHEHVARRMGLLAWDEIATPQIGLAQLDVYQALGEYVSSGVGERLRGAMEELRNAAESEGRVR